MNIKINGKVDIFLTILLVLLVFLIVPYFIMHLWNWLMPQIFAGVGSLTYLKALALYALVWLLTSDPVTN